MKRIFNILIVLLLFSCDNSLSNEEVRSLFYFSFNIHDLSLQKSKAGVAVEESSVSNIWIIQFDGINDNSKLTKANYISEIADINNLRVQLNIGANQRILFIANTFDNQLFNNINAPLYTYTYSDFKMETITYTSESSVFRGSTNKYLILFGEYIGNIPNSNSSVDLYHINAKITITYSSEESQDIFNPGILKVKSVQLKNIPETSPYFMVVLNSSLTNPQSLINYNLVNDTNTGSGVGESYSIGDYSGSISFYMPENISGIVNEITSENTKALFAPQKATYIEFLGEYLINNEFFADVQFNLYLGKNNTTDFNVNSNFHYIVNIKFLGIDTYDTRVIINYYSSINEWSTEFL